MAQRCLIFALPICFKIRDIFEMAGAAKDQYRKTMDNTIYYMKSLNIPKDLQDRVKTWFNYNWEHSKTLSKCFCPTWFVPRYYSRY